MYEAQHGHDIVSYSYIHDRCKWFTGYIRVARHEGVA